jgi:transcriptional regulator with XRE-family HTH domain
MKRSPSTARAIENRRTFERELLFGESTETIHALLQSMDISQKELAQRLGLTEGRVSRILSGRENVTLRTLADVGWAIGIRFALVPLPFEDRADTPAADDPPPPRWLARLRRLATSRRVAGLPSKREGARNDPTRG